MNFSLERLAKATYTVLAAQSIVWLIVVLGILRTVLLLWAYPPARGADAFDYYLYAMRLDGYANLAAMANHVSPLYAYFVHLTYNVLGSGYGLIALQVLMAISITPLFYFALRPYQPVLAALVSFIIVADVQFHVQFNFVASEALYVYLIALLFFCILRGLYAAKQSRVKEAQIYFFVSGLLLTALFLTRPPAKLLFIPVTVLIGLLTFSWGYFLRASAGVLLGFLLYMGLSFLMVGQVEGFISGLGMLRRAASDFSADTEAAYSVERPGEGGNLTHFVQTQAGLLTRDLPRFALTVGENVIAYLAMNGQQLGLESVPDRPSRVQCEDYPHPPDYDSWITVEVVDKNFDPLPATAENAATLQALMPIFRDALCPELWQSEALQQGVDALAWRYRSLGRPAWQIPFWYGGVFILAGFIPALRRFLPLLLVAGLILLYHAGVSAAVMDTQARYVVVMNPLRALLLTLLPFMLVDWFYHWRMKSSVEKVVS